MRLRPATIQDKEQVYDWLAHSNLTSEMLGPPDFPDNPVPTWEEFNKDYLDHYFDGSRPLRGRCFILVYNEQAIGQINYNEIDTESNSTEIDIWLADRKFIAKGVGSEAIKILFEYLDKTFNCKTIYVAPSRRNAMAIKAYAKAGFIETQNTPVNFFPDYCDTIVMTMTRSK